MMTSGQGKIWEYYISEKCTRILSESTANATDAAQSAERRNPVEVVQRCVVHNDIKFDT